MGLDGLHCTLGIYQQEPDFTFFELVVINDPHSATLPAAFAYPANFLFLGLRHLLLGAQTASM